MSLNKAIGGSSTQARRERLVVIVLTDKHDAARLRPRRIDRLVVRHSHVRRFLDEHVLAGRQRL